MSLFLPISSFFVTIRFFLGDHAMFCGSIKKKQKNMQNSKLNVEPSNPIQGVTPFFHCSALVGCLVSDSLVIYLLILLY